MIYRRTTLAYYIKMLCSDYAEKTAIIHKTKYRTKKIKYKTLLKYSKKTAAYFLNQNLKKGDRVFLIGPNSPQWVAALFGTVTAGLVLVPVDYNSSPDFIKKIIKESKPSLFIASKLLIKKMPKSISGEKIIFLKNLFCEIEKTDESVLETKYDFYLNGNDAAQIIFTSGTTDEPKGVVLTHRNIGANIQSCSLRININSGTKLLSILPLSHMFEQVAGLFTPLRQGGKIIYLDSMKPGNIKNALFSEKVNIMAVVPAFLNTFKNLILLNIENKNMTKKFLKVLKFAEKQNIFMRRIIFKSLLKVLGGKMKFVISGGSYLNIETEKFWNTIGIKVLQGYGLTETSPVVCCTDMQNKLLGTVGKVLPHQNIKIEDDGEILTSGENVFSGYLNKNELNKTIFKNGWFKTGDMGEIDDRGNLFIKGRKKNIIVSPSGLNIYPEDIEKKLNLHSEIKDCIVMNNNDNKNFYLTAYYISDEEIEKSNSLKILKMVNSNLASHQKLKSLIRWPFEDFPRTPTRKIIRKEISKILSINEKNNLSSKEIKKTAVKNEMDQIISFIKEITGIKDDLTSSSSLIEDAGMDSIQKLELLTKIEAHFMVDIDEEKFYQTDKINDIFNLIQEYKRNPDFTKVETSIFISKINIIKVIIQSVFFIFFRFFSFFLFRVKKEGVKNIINFDENFIIAANHSSHLDWISIYRALPPFLRRKTFTAAAFDYFFQNKIISSSILSFLFNIFPFYRKDMMRKNLMNMGLILDNNKNIVIFPEGTRSRDGKMNKFKNGIGMIIQSMEIPCIPVKIENSFNLLPYNKKIPKQGTVKVKFGNPILFSNDMDYGEITEKLQKSIEVL